MSDEELKRVLDDLSNRRKPCSELLDESIPLLRGRISDDELAWLAQEKEGYGVLEGTREGLLPRLKEYRNVYFHRLEMLANGKRTGNPIACPDNQPRLNYLGWPLKKGVEAFIASSEDEFGVPHPEGFGGSDHL